MYCVTFNREREKDRDKDREKGYKEREAEREKQREREKKGLPPIKKENLSGKFGQNIMSILFIFEGVVQTSQYNNITNIN